ncbi:hypothetical protein K474DRAFT_1702005 [Panus rudis PR-1116 ss-1]|nr:hypothetical protein K474DRAFT_1702005 [Panus rudis PR-1116 ss-1]
MASTKFVCPLYWWFATYSKTLMENTTVVSLVATGVCPSWQGKDLLNLNNEDDTVSSADLTLTSSCKVCTKTEGVGWWSPLGKCRDGFGSLEGVPKAGDQTSIHRQNWPIPSRYAWHTGFQTQGKRLPDIQAAEDIASALFQAIGVSTDDGHV